MKRSKKVVEKVFEKFSKAGEKSGGFLGIGVKNGLVILAVIFSAIVVGFVIFVSSFGKGFKSKITHESGIGV